MKLILTCYLLFHIQVSVAQNKDTFYIAIPYTLKKGTITYEMHADANDSTFSIIFGKLTDESEKKSAGLLLQNDRSYTTLDSIFFKNKIILSPANVMDSLFANGRPFIKKNNFYCVFIRGFHFYTHRVRCEFI